MQQQQPERFCVILAAGQGKRMQSDLAKVLHAFAGRPMVDWVVDAARNAGANRISVVVGHQREQVESHLASLALPQGMLVTAVQDRQLGTGHAAQCGLTPWAGDPAADAAEVLILCGDTPMLNGDRLAGCFECLAQENTAAVVMTFDVEGEHAYGRIVRSSPGGPVERIVEDRDCAPAEKQIREVNSGVYAFRMKDLREALGSLTNENAQGEYYLTDCIGYLASRGRRVAALVNPDAVEVSGVNSREQLVALEKAYRSAEAST